MGTRSRIIVQLSTGKFASIYCHFDGYIENNGRILFEHYNSQELAESLVALGDLSTLGEVIGEKHSFDWQTQGVDWDEPEKMKAWHASDEYKRLNAMCLAYGRDRGETGTEPDIDSSLLGLWPGKASGAEYIYVWKDGEWFVSTSTAKNLRPLGPKVLRLKKDKAA